MMQDQEIVTGNWNLFDFLIGDTSPIIIIIVVVFFIFLLLSIFMDKKGVNRMKRGRIFIFIIIFGFIFIPQSNNVYSQDIISEPIVEVLDLNVDGSPAIFVNISKDFDYIKRIIWSLDFVENLYSVEDFAGDSALTNGINVYYNDISLLDNLNITSNHGFAHASYDMNLHSDEQSPENRLLITRWTFTKFINGVSLGLLINSARTLAFHIQDDISALGSISEFKVIVEGFSDTVSTYFSTDELYYPNAYNSINLRFLETNTNYNLKINSSSTEVLEWVNTTAKSETIKVTFVVETKNDNVLSLWLYEDNTFLERHDLVVVPIQTGIIEIFLSFLPYGIAAFLAVSLFLALAIPEKFSRRK